MMRRAILAIALCACAAPAAAADRGPMPCRVSRVIDGDTVVCDLSLGYGVWLMARPVRLSGIDAPELPTPEGKAAREALEGLLAASPSLLFVPDPRERKDKYGRFLGRLLGAEDIAAAMLRLGHAKPYDGGKR